MQNKSPRLQHGKEMDSQLVQETVCLMKEAIDDHLEIRRVIELCCINDDSKTA